MVYLNYSDNEANKLQECEQFGIQSPVELINTLVAIQLTFWYTRTDEDRRQIEGFTVKGPNGLTLVMFSKKGSLKRDKGDFVRNNKWRSQKYSNEIMRETQWKYLNFSSQNVQSTYKILADFAIVDVK